MGIVALPFAVCDGGAACRRRECTDWWPLSGWLMLLGVLVDEPLAGGLKNARPPLLVGFQASDRRSGVMT
jgi:hypothetical protein